MVQRLYNNIIHDVGNYLLAPSLQISFLIIKNLKIAKCQCFKYRNPTTHFAKRKARVIIHDVPKYLLPRKKKKLAFFILDIFSDSFFLSKPFLLGKGEEGSRYDTRKSSSLDSDFLFDSRSWKGCSTDKCFREPCVS